ncbi:MAG: hypothetical protein WD757_04685 [Actinomycetota bacterium]
MAERQWERVAAMSGVAFVVTVVMSLALTGPPPTFDKPIEEIASYYDQHRSGIAYGGYLNGLAIIFGLWFLGSLRSFLRRAEGDTGRISAVVFGAGILAGAMALAGSLFNSVVALDFSVDSSPEIVRALYSLSSLSFSFFWFPITVLAAGTSVVAARSKAFPDWFVWAGVLGTALFLVAGSSVHIDGGIFGPAGAMTFISLIVFLLWFGGASVLLYGKLAKE